MHWVWHHVISQRCCLRSSMLHYIPCQMTHLWFHFMFRVCLNKDIVEVTQWWVSSWVPQRDSESGASHFSSVHYRRRGVSDANTQELEVRAAGA
jgi:hypothetical protein